VCFDHLSFSYVSDSEEYELSVAFLTSARGRDWAAAIQQITASYWAVKEKGK